jgi:L-asparaginase/Glu-tRNA(Gln) amidotransferase subunit D
MNRLLLLATGGTIAGCADDSATLNDYTAGVLGGDALLAAVPQLQIWRRSGGAGRQCRQRRPAV